MINFLQVFLEDGLFSPLKLKTLKIWSKPANTFDVMSYKRPSKNDQNTRAKKHRRPSKKLFRGVESELNNNLQIYREKTCQQDWK